MQVVAVDDVVVGGAVVGRLLKSRQLENSYKFRSMAILYQRTPLIVLFYLPKSKGDASQQHLT